MSVTDYSITKFQNYVHIKLLKNAFPRWSQQQKHVQFKWNHYLGNMSMCWQFYHIRYFELETFLKQIFFIIFTKKEIFHLFLLKKKYFCCVGYTSFICFWSFFLHQQKLLKSLSLKAPPKQSISLWKNCLFADIANETLRETETWTAREREIQTDRKRYSEIISFFGAILFYFSCFRQSLSKLINTILRLLLLFYIW